MRRLVGLCIVVLAVAACNGEDDVALDGTPEPATPATPATPADTPTPDAPLDGDAATPTPDAELPEPLPSDSWTALSDAPVALSEVAAAPFAGDVWVGGGFTADGDATSRVLRYDPTFDQWQDGPPLPRPVHHAAFVGSDVGLMLVGGYAGSGFGEPSDEVWLLDPAVGDWEQIVSLPAPRGAGAAAFDGERVVYGGGVGPDGLAGDVFALEAGEWRTVGLLSEPREHLAAASDGLGLVWFLGGRTAGLDTNLTAVDLVEDGQEPRRIGDLLTARGGIAGFYAPGSGGCAVGGENPDRTHDEVECVDADGNVTTLPPLAAARHGLGAVRLDGIAYTLLGGPEPFLAVSPTVEALRLD